MTLRSGILFLVTLLCLLISSPAGAQLPGTEPEAVGLSTERLERLATVLKTEIEKGAFPGAVVLVARRGKVAYFESLGMRDAAAGTPMDKETIFRLHSMTKPITSVGIMMLQEEGRLFLQDPVSKYIPEFKELQVGVERTDGTTGNPTFSTVPAKRQMTIHDLLRHTSGLTASFLGKSKVKTMYKEAGVPSRDQTLAELVKKLGKLPLAHQPGTTWEYSKSTDVLGRVIEIVSGASLEQFFQERIFRPLGMSDTAFWAPPEKRNRLVKVGPNAKWKSRNVSAPPKLLSGGGGLVSTAGDYARFLQMLLNGGELDGVRLLGRNTVDYMTTDHLGSISKTGRYYLPGAGHSFGLGFAVREHPGVSTLPGTVGDYWWLGVAGTSFFVDPREELLAVFMVEFNNLGKLRHYTRLFKTLVMQAIID